MEPQARLPMIKWKRLILLAISFFAFLYAVITGVMSMLYAGEVIHPKQASVSPINRNLANPYTSVSFRSRVDEVLLHGWHFNAKKTDKALIVVHGFGGNRFPFGEETLDLIEAVISLDFNVLVFDLRNSGGTVAGISTFGIHEKKDVLGAVDYMRGVGYEHIAILGVSTGANAAALAGAETTPEEVGALILDSPVVDMSSFIMHRVRAGRPRLPDFPFNLEVPLLAGIYINGEAADADATKSLIQFVPRNVQLIHGTNDEIVSLADITGLYNEYMSRAVGKISIWSVSGAAHGECYMYEKDEYLERVTLFLARTFL